jgi:UPF0042 nucleotide-binding protein
MDRPDPIAEAAWDEAPRLEGGLAPQIVIVSGLSGAGKSHVLHCFEDVGFFCVDNLPPPLIPTFVHLCTQGDGRSQRIGLGIDIRGREFLAQSFATIERLKSQGYRVEILFLEARTDCWSAVLRDGARTRSRRTARSSGHRAGARGWSCVTAPT